MSSKDGAAKRLAEWRALVKKFPLEKINAIKPPHAACILGMPEPDYFPLELKVDVEKPINHPLVDAFKAFGLDHKNLSDWRRLMSIFADVHFSKHKPGRPKDWTDLKLCQLLIDFTAIQRDKPGRPETEVCHALKK